MRMEDPGVMVILTIIRVRCGFTAAISESSDGVATESMRMGVVDETFSLMKWHMAAVEPSMLPR
jgi:hypothetical protein